MKTNYFKPNWKAINEAISNDIKGLRDAQEELTKKIQNKIDAFYKAKRDLEQMQMILNLKSLPINSAVYFIGRYDPNLKYGTVCIKRSDGIKRMKVDVDGRIWTCPYRLLRIKEVTDQEKRDRKLESELSRMFNNAINK